MEGEKERSIKKERAEVQKVGKKSYRVQIAHPIRPGERLSVSGTSESKVKERAEYLKGVRWQLKKGVINEAAARQIIEREYRPVSVKDLWDAYVSTQKEREKKHFQSMWALRIVPMFGEKMAFELDESEMRAWEQIQEKEVKKATIRKVFDCLQAAYNMELRKAAPRIDRLPWGSWRPKREMGEKHAPKREACRSLEELERLIWVAKCYDAIRQKKGKYSDIAFRVLIIALCGLRQGEASGLGWDCVHIDENELTVGGVPWIEIKYQACKYWTRDNPKWTRPLEPPKDGPRSLALHRSAVEAFKNLREYQQQKGLWMQAGPVFPAVETGWRTKPECISPRFLRKLAEEAQLPNLDKWVTHSLRHTFATLELVASGGDLRTVQERTGHSSVKVLQGYLHAVGRGLPGSSLPELRLMPQGPKVDIEVTEIAPGVFEQKETPRLPVMGAMRGLELAMLDLAKASTDQAKGFEEERRKKIWEKRKKAREKRAEENKSGKKQKSFAQIAKEWLALPDVQKGNRPKEITERADAKYRAAYHTELRRTGEVKIAQKAGTRARSAVMGGWSKALKKVMIEQGIAPKILMLKN